MSFEVEIKAWLGKGVTRLAEELASVSGEVPEPVTQADSIFVPAPLRLRDVDARTTPITRIREQDSSRVTLTLKRNRTDELDSIEHEVEVSSAAVISQILAELGLHRVLSVRKVRRTWHIGAMSVNLDQVDGLGAFVECEALVGSSVDIDSCRQSMWEWLRQWDITEADAVRQGYDRLLDSVQDSTPA